MMKPLAQLVVLSFGVGISFATVPVAKRAIEDQAREAVAALAADYQLNNAAGFLRRVDSDAFPNFVAFREAIRDFLRDNHQINFQFVYDSTLTKGHQRVVNLRWDRTFVDRKGALHKQAGRCELLFHRQKSGQPLLLIAIHGQSPF